LAGLSGIVFSLYTSAGYSLAAVGVELDAIAAVVIGGTALAGGTGTVVGTLAGTLIGVSASLLFIPFFQVREGDHPQTPPFLVQIAWGQIELIYLVFGALLATAVLVTLALLRRMQLFQAIKLGEAI
jgi:ribose/xylose/arabinose/galactoside ABC-type transport system permease subunit